MRTKPKAKIYIEIKPGQEQIIKNKPAQRMGIEIDTGIGKLKMRMVPDKMFEETRKFFQTHGIKIKETAIEQKTSYIKILGHKITKLGKNDCVIPVRGQTLEDALAEVMKVELELKQRGIKFERKCTWICGL